MVLLLVLRGGDDASRARGRATGSGRAPEKFPAPAWGRDGADDEAASRAQDWLSSSTVRRRDGSPASHELLAQQLEADHAGLAALAEQAEAAPAEHADRAGQLRQRLRDRAPH